MTDLQRLIEAVECGGIERHDLDAFVPVFGVTTQGNDAHMAYRGSLDAAKALHDALLPEWGWEVHSNNFCILRGPRFLDVHLAESNTPARAWLIAILKAYQAQQVTLAT